MTTYKYHYIGGQITEIEIDAIRNPGEGQTVLRNEEVKIHLGANSQPISYEWVKHVGESTTSATYYYHYDIHGNVLKVTDSSENVKITYTYDVLGKILTETNPDSILNFFTFRGASQTIWDSEVGMYYSGGYYRPDTGTALQGTGAPVLTNPVTGSMISAMAQVNQINRQMAIQARRAVKTAGVTGGGRPGGFAPPPGPSDGMSRTGRASPPPNPNPTPPTLDATLVETGGGNVIGSVFHGFEGVNIDPLKDKYKDVILPGPGWGDNLKITYATDDMDADGLPDDFDDDDDGDGIADKDDMKDENGDGYDDETGYDKNGYNKQGYNRKGEFNPAYDRDTSDDGSQYTFVIRDTNGNIVFCETLAGLVGWHPGVLLFMYLVDENGVRKGNVAISGSGKATDENQYIDNWYRICNAIQNNLGISVNFYDDAGNPTNGSIGIQVDKSGTFVGILHNKDGTNVVGKGKRKDFGYPDEGYQGYFMKNSTIIVRQCIAGDNNSWSCHRYGGRSGGVNYNGYSYTKYLHWPAFDMHNISMPVHWRQHGDVWKWDDLESPDYP